MTPEQQALVNAKLYSKNGEGPRCFFCHGEPHEMKDCPACASKKEMEKTIQNLTEEVKKLKGIIARNALQRLAGEEAAKFYLTPDDIRDSLTILYEWQKR